MPTPVTGAFRSSHVVHAVITTANRKTGLRMSRYTRQLRRDSRKQHLIARAAVHNLTVAPPPRKNFTPQQVISPAGSLSEVRTGQPCRAPAERQPARERDYRSRRPSAPLEPARTSSCGSFRATQLRLRNETERPRACPLCSVRDRIAAGRRGGGCEIRTREGLHPTRFPSLWTCVRDRSTRSVTWRCGLVRSSADALEPRRMRPERRPAWPRP